MMVKSDLLSIRYTEFESPIGMIILEGKPDQITRLRLPGENPSEAKAVRQLSANESYPALTEAMNWLKNYFAKDTSPWSAGTLPELSPFSKQVYDALLKIGFGETVSYGELAILAGRPGAARAVGRAMAQNPLAILIPCHRVLGADKSLHGYGGGLPMKQALLEHEGVILK